jgi:hypothetical protein
MPYAIAGTAFTWDPDRETRGMALRRMRKHLEQELGRIQQEHVLRRRLERRLAAPTADRNRQLAQAATTGATPVQLARRFGLRPERVRQILRQEAELQQARAQIEARGVPAPHWPAAAGVPVVFPSLQRTSTSLQDP